MIQTGTTIVDSTMTVSESSWYPTMQPQGWICPKCGNVYAPHVDECKNCNGYRYNFPTPYIPPYTPWQPTKPYYIWGEYPYTTISNTTNITNEIEDIQVYYNGEMEREKILGNN